MAYKCYIYRFNNSNEYEYVFNGNYGAKGEKRAARRKKTKEQMAKANQIQKETRCRRLIKANFEEKDLWVTFKYPAGYRPDIESVRKDRTKLLRSLRREYEKENQEFKFISRMEVGAQGGIHFHMLVNRIWNSQTDVILQNAWNKILQKSVKGISQGGYVDYTLLYDSGGYEGLARYITKQPEEESPEYEQLSLFNELEQKKLLSISSSRNLKRPVPEEHPYKRRTMRKIMENGPEPSDPTKFYIDKDSIRQGINPYSGQSFLKYTEIRIDPIKRGYPPNRERGIP